MVYISAGLSDSIRTYAGFRVLELIFCFAGYDIATCNFEDCRGFGEFYSRLVVASCFVRNCAGFWDMSKLI